LGGSCYIRGKGLVQKRFFSSARERRRKRGIKKSWTLEGRRGRRLQGTGALRSATILEKEGSTSPNIKAVKNRKKEGVGK